VEIVGAHADGDVSNGPGWLESFIDWRSRAIRADLARAIRGAGEGTKLKTESKSRSLRCAAGTRIREWKKKPAASVGMTESQVGTLEQK